MFGAAVQEVERRIANATDTISKNAKPLAETSIQAKILKVDMEALASDFAMTLKPAVDSIVESLDKLAVASQKHSRIFQAIVGVLFPPIGGLELASAIQGARGRGAGFSLPSLLSPMQQMPVSQWEKMGLVIAGGLQNRAIDYARRTAVATEKLARGMSNTLPRGMQNFGMSLEVANP